MVAVDGGRYEEGFYLILSHLRLRTAQPLSDSFQKFDNSHTQQLPSRSGIFAPYRAELGVN